jgi:flagellar basal body-associated protein FliL
MVRRRKMKTKILLVPILVTIVLFLITGCMSSKGWTRKDGQPIDQDQFQKDFASCNRGAWTLSITQYLIAKKCMERHGYIK